MSEIKSDKSSVENHVIQMGNVVGSFPDMGTVLKDEQTRLQGNAKAHAAISQLEQFSKELVKILTDSVERVQIIADSLQTTDEQGARNFEGE